MCSFNFKAVLGSAATLAGSDSEDEAVRAEFFINLAEFSISSLKMGSFLTGGFSH